MLLNYRLEKEDHRKVIGILTGQCPLNKQLFDIGVSGNRQPSVKEMHEDKKRSCTFSQNEVCGQINGQTSSNQHHSRKHIMT